MKNIMANLLIAVVLLLLVPLAGAQSISFKPQWTTTLDKKYLDTSVNQLYIRPREQQSGPREMNATTKLNLPDSQTWKVSFEVRFGIEVDAANGVRLCRGDTILDWIGADGSNKATGIFLGEHNEVYAQPQDIEWHQVNYVCNGQKLSAWLDGKKVGETTQQQAPDVIEVYNTQDMTVPCNQTGLWVRNINPQSSATTTPSEAGASSSSQNLPQQDQLKKKVDE